MPRFTALLVSLAAMAVAETQVVLLGTGTPNADPARSGPSTAIVVNGSSYVVDLGPGVVRRAAAAKIAALAPGKLRIAFLTHLHSDHTAGLSDFYLTPAVLDRHGPLLLFGPKGTKRMARHIEQAYKADVENRVAGLEHGDRASYRIDAREFRAGKIYEDANVIVTAIPVQHGDWNESYGFLFATRDGKRIVVSGDTVASENIVRACNGCDVLVHEVYAEAGWRKREPQWQRYHKAAHTSGPDLGRLAQRARPKKLVLTHILLWTSTMEELLGEIRAGFSGAIHAGQDLDVIGVP